ncbi:MAG: DUF3572 domain-containing protein [Paracoccaceae bacterium]
MQHNNLQPLPLDQAEHVSVAALGWIAADQDLTGAFLGATGASVEDLRAGATDPEFLGFVLDFLLADEAALVAFCTDQGIAPDRPMRARAALPGGNLPHWT